MADALANHEIVNKLVDECTNQIFKRWVIPLEAINYVLEKRCEGFYQLCLILHTVYLKFLLEIFFPTFEFGTGRGLAGVKTIDVIKGFSFHSLVVSAVKVLS